jgi:hypothetical protein
MRLLPLILILVAAIAAPPTLVAQEGEDAPSMLRLSFFMCNTTRLDEALQEAEEKVIPVWEELVAEGMVDNYGYIVHRWADEWNVGIYTIAESVDAVIKASEEAARRIEQRYGDSADAFGQACPHHRDGFYAFGPSTGGNGGGEGGSEADEGGN